MTQEALRRGTPADEGSPGRPAPGGARSAVDDRPTWWVSPDHTDPDATPVYPGPHCPGGLEHCHGAEVRHADGWRECLAAHPCTAIGGAHAASVRCTSVARDRVLALHCPSCAWTGAGAPGRAG